MLIRIRGDVSGIVDYLVEGRKSGREYSRDELDERVILAGDLSVTDAVINTIESSGDRYKHITLSFKEDFISRDMLKSIAADFRTFCLSAYRDDEINFYAEAHLPKIKGYENARTGEEVERKPHIHIVVPKVNLLAWKQSDPFGYFDFSERHVMAFQQIINEKYGLSDPQENRRLFTATSSESITRYKGDLFAGANKDIRGKIFEAVLERNVTSIDDFQSMLKEFGTVQVRKEGTSSVYFNIKLSGDKKGINLKDYGFAPVFLSLSKEEKMAFLTLEIQKRYEAAGPSRKTSAECEALLVEWKEYRAKEAKYINSGNKKFYAEYKAMSRAEKIALLADREFKFYEKHLGIDNERFQAEGRTDQRTAAFERIGNNLESSSANLTAARGIAGSFNQGARNAANRAALRAVAAVIAGRGGHQAANHASSQQIGHSATSAGGRLVGQYRYEHDHKQTITRSEKQAEFSEIKQHLDAARLLAYLSKSHGLIVEKYAVTQGQDGSERIKCGNQNLNVSDFLTKEMHLPWKEAAPILRDVYAHQTGQAHYQAKAPLKSELWNHFREWKAETVPVLKADASNRIAADHAQALAKIRKDYNAYCSRIEDDRNITKGQAKLLKNIAKAEREHKKIEARTVRDTARLAYRAQWSGKGEHLYKRFLAEAAQSDVPYADEALTELRKRAPDVMEKDDAAQYIRAVDAQAEAQATPIRRDLSYKVDMQGHVTYKIDGREALKDEGQRIKVLQPTDSGVIEQGLALARSKFGKTISLHGSDTFKAQVVAVAVQKNMDIDFSDPRLERLKLELQQQRQHERDQRARQMKAGQQALEIAQAKKEEAEACEKDKAKARENDKAKPKTPKVKPEIPKLKPEKTQGENPAPATPTLPPVTTAPEHPVEGSQAPYRAYATYTGKVVALTDVLVYQQTKDGLFHHSREAFKKDSPEVGQVLKIKYTDKKIVSYKSPERDGTGHGL